MEVLDGTVRHQQTVLQIKVGPCFCRSIKGMLNAISVVGMNSFEYHRYRRLRRSILFEDIVRFYRPIDFSALNTPAEATRVAQALPLRQEGFAALQLFVGFCKLDSSLRDLLIEFASHPFLFAQEPGLL